MPTILQRFVCVGAAILILAGSAFAQTTTQSTTPANTPDDAAFDVAMRTRPEFSALRGLVKEHIEL